MDDKFYLENGERVSPSDKIARELCQTFLFIEIIQILFQPK